jgi:hypothetical protein
LFWKSTAKIQNRTIPDHLWFAVSFQDIAAFAKIEENLFQDHIQGLAFIDIDVVLRLSTYSVEIDLVLRHSFHFLVYEIPFDGSLMNLGGLPVVNLCNGFRQRRGQVRKRLTAAGATSIVEVPTVLALQAAALRTAAQICFLRCCKTDLASPNLGWRSGDARPPAFLHRKDGHTLLQAEMATAMLEAPAALLTYLKLAARTLKDDGLRPQAPAAETTSRPIPRKESQCRKRGTGHKDRDDREERADRFDESSNTYREQRSCSQRDRRNPYLPVRKIEVHPDKGAYRPKDNRRKRCNTRSKKICAELERGRKNNQPCQKCRSF